MVFKLFYNHTEDFLRLTTSFNISKFSSKCKFHNGFSTDKIACDKTSLTTR